MERINKTNTKTNICSVVVWGTDNSNALGLIRQLQSVGFEILFIINKKPGFCVVKSSFCPKYIIVPDLEGGYNYLLEHAADFPTKPALISTSDVIAEMIDQHKEILSRYYVVMGTKESGLLTKILDKNYMCDMAKECGFRVPASVAWRTSDPIPEIDYPCLVKPNKKSVIRPKPFKTKKCDNKESLVNLLGSVPQGCEFIIQDFVPKESDLLIYGCRLLDGTIIMPGALIKERWSIYGDGSYGQILKSAPKGFDSKPIKSFLERISYYGLFSFEFGLYKNEYYFYEVNLRNDGTSHYFFQAGVNLPAAWVLSSYGMSYDKELGVIERDYYFMDEVFDRLNVKSGVVSKREWKKQYKESSIFVYYQKSDPKPYYYMRVKAFAKSIQMKIRKA